MEEIEVPIEKIQEDLHEKVHEEQEQHHPHASFSSSVALTSAFLAVFAAIAALLAGHHSNEAMIEQIRASDHWSYYQAKGIKSAILSSKAELLVEMGKPVDPKTEEKMSEYKKEQEEIQEKAKEKQAESELHLKIHQILARAVTFFQIAITIAAISVLTHRKRFWYVSMVFGGIGLMSLIQGLLTK